MIIAVVGATIPFIVGAFAFMAHSWILGAIAAATLIIYSVWASRRVHHFECVACGHDVRDHHRLGEKADVKACIPRSGDYRRCGCRITDDSPLRPVTLYSHVERLLEPFNHGG